jgi:hypothetical protein
MSTTNTTTQTKNDRLISFLNTLGLDIDFNYHLKGEDPTNADELEDILNDASAFDVDVTYHSNAIEYLREHDPSLLYSLELAHGLGYTTDNINSEILASLLATDNLRDDFTKLKGDIDNFFDELTEEIETEAQNILDAFNSEFNTEIEDFETLQAFLDDEASEYITEEERQKFINVWTSEIDFTETRSFFNI